MRTPQISVAKNSSIAFGHPASRTEAKHVVSPLYSFYLYLLLTVPYIVINRFVALSSMIRTRTVFMTFVALALIATPLVLAGNAYAAPNTKVRAIQNGVSLDESVEGNLVNDVDCVAGIEGSGTADEVKCYLVPDGIATPDYATTPIPPQTSTTEDTCPTGVGFTGGYKCFTTTFDSSNFSNGHWRFVAEYYLNGQLVDIKGSNVWTNHSFFVLPESPIGILALVASSLAALGGFMFLKRRNAGQLPI